MSWCIAYFYSDEAYEVLPSTWVKGNGLGDYQCEYPPLEGFKLYDAFKNRLPPNNWKNSYQVKILGRFDDFDVAQSKAEIVREGGEISSTCEKKLYGRGHRPKKPKKTEDYLLNQDTDEDDLIMGHCNIRFPKDPFSKSISQSKESDIPKISLISEPVQVSTDESNCDILAVENNNIRIIQKNDFENSQDNKTNSFIDTYVNNRPAANNNLLLTIEAKIDKFVAQNKEFQCQILRHLFSLNSKIQDLQTTVLNIQLQNQDPVSENNDVQFMEIYQKFPLETPDELDNMENLLVEHNLLDKLAKEFSRVGGENPKDITRTLLYRILSNELASKYSLDGFKGKLKFKDLRIYHLLLLSVRYNDKTNKATEKDIIPELRQWLAQVKFRKTK